MEERTNNCDIILFESVKSLYSAIVDLQKLTLASTPNCEGEGSLVNKLTKKKFLVEDIILEISGNNENNFFSYFEKLNFFEKLKKFKKIKIFNCCIKSGLGKVYQNMKMKQKEIKKMLSNLENFFSFKAQKSLDKKNLLEERKNILREVIIQIFHFSVQTQIFLTKLEEQKKRKIEQNEKKNFFSKNGIKIEINKLELSDIIRKEFEANDWGFIHFPNLEKIDEFVYVKKSQGVAHYKGSTLKSAFIEESTIPKFRSKKKFFLTNFSKNTLILEIQF